MTNSSNNNFATSAVDVLAQNGFLPGNSAPRVEDFVRAAKEGWDEVVGAYCAMGMSQDAKNKAFMAAVEGGHITTIDLMLANGADIEFKDDSDDTALRTAFNWSHPEIAKHLVKKGCSVEAVNKYDETALEHAIEKNPEYVATLLEMGANPNFVKNGRSPVRTALMKGDNDPLRALLDKGGNPNLVIDEQHRVTALHEAVSRSNGDAVSLYVERGANVDAKDAYGLTPVDYALMKGDDGVLETMRGENWASSVAPQQRARAEVWKLVEAGQNEEAIAAMEKEDVGVDTRNESHQTFLAAFAKAGYLDGVKRLLARGAKPTSEAVSAAVYAGHDEVLAALFDAGAPIFDDKGECSGISGAVWEGHAAVVKRVLDKCTPAEKQKFGPSLESAAMQKNLEIVEILVKGGAGPLDFHDDIGGDTPLIRAVASWHSTEVVKALIDGGAKIEEPDAHQCTPLQKHTSHYAWDETFEPTTRLMLERGAKLDSINWLDNTPFDDGKDGAKELLAKIVVHEPLEKGVSVAELAKQQSWATLPIFLHAERADLLPELMDAMKQNGIALDAPPGTKTKGLLNWAIEKKNVDVVRLCVERGVDVNRATSYGWTPFLTACCQEDKDGDGNVLAMIKLLLDAGADLHARTDSGTGAVGFSIDAPEQLKLVIEKGADFGGNVDPPILAAAMKGNVEAVKVLTALKVPLDVRDSYGRTPLTLAIEKEHAEVAKLLIEAGASGSFINRDTGDTPLTAATKQGDVELVRLLVAKGGDIEAKNKAGESACDLMLRRKALRQAFADVLTAKGFDVSVPKVEKLDASLTKPKNDAWATLYRGDADSIVALIESKKIGINEQDAWGMTPLMAAAAWRDTELVRRLLEIDGVNVELVDHATTPAQAWDYIGFDRDSDIDELLSAKGAKNSMDRMNAQAARSLVAGELKTAFERGELNKVAALVREKKVHAFLTPNSSTPLLNTSMDLAEGDEDVLGVLLDLGLSPDVADRDGNAPLMIALRDGHTAQVERLLEAGARLDQPGLLANIVERGKEEAVTWLLERGADVTAKNKRGLPILHVAIDNGYPEIAGMLAKAKGIDFTATDEEGNPALHFAMRRWRYSGEEAAKAILDAGADVNVRDREGRTALYIAVDEYDDDAGRFLVERGASLDDRCRALMAERDMRPNWPAEEVRASSSNDDNGSDDNGNDDNGNDDNGNDGNDNGSDDNDNGGGYNGGGGGGGGFSNTDGGGAL